MTINKMTIELAEQTFLDAEFFRVDNMFIAHYKSHMIADQDLMNLVQRLWLANA